MKDDLAVHRSQFIIHRFFLPARLRNAWDMPFEREIAEADSAERELAQVSPTATATATPIMHTRRENV
jgi:hypothetical protein